MILEAKPSNIELAARTLKAGELVAFPTETVYGLGADALNEAAVEKIFSLKGRPSWNPLIVHLSSTEEAHRVAQLDALGSKLQIFETLSALWPGPLSLVVPKAPTLSDLVTAGRATVAIRVPRHPVALALLRACGCPLAAPSANRFMTISPTSAEHVAQSFGEESPMILDGGPCEIGLESTVVDLTSDPVRLLRPGGTSFEQLEDLIGEICLSSSLAEEDSGAISPGLSRKHYSPKTRLFFIDEVPQEVPRSRSGVICFNSREDASEFSVVRELSMRGDLDEAAKNLFSALRELDQMNLEAIVVERCSEHAIGRALMDRLRRATERE